VVGLSGAVWIDSDGDGKRSSAYDYAMDAWKRSKRNLKAFIKSLGFYDEAVAMQAAAILQQEGLLPELEKALPLASADTRKGFEIFLKEWKASMKTVSP
jgi:hypothetical protein